MGKLFNKAPLPFVGQKRMFLRHFKAILEKHIPSDGEGWEIVDVFGGSGLLAHTAKQLKPKAKVIYNDFDNYCGRLANVADTNRLRGILCALIGQNKTEVKGRLSDELNAEVIRAIEAFDGYKDLDSISSWLLFSGRFAGSFAELYKHGFYNRVPLIDYCVEGYLYGVETVRHSFEELLMQYQEKPNALLILDPPYITTRHNMYKMDNYFDLINFLQLIHLTRPPYIFFSSTKSEFPRFMEYICAKKKDNYQAFENAQRITVKAVASYAIQYEDNLVYKF